MTMDGKDEARDVLIPRYIKELRALSPDHDLVHIDWQHTDDSLDDLLHDLKEALDILAL